MRIFLEFSDIEVYFIHKNDNLSSHGNSNVLFLSNLRSLPFEHLTKFVIGSLISVFCLAICSEYYFSVSQGVQERKDNFSCLANYLQQQNVSDEYFTTVVSNISESCEELVSQLRLKIVDDMKDYYYISYNVSTSLCDEIDQNLKLMTESTNFESDLSLNGTNVEDLSNFAKGNCGKVTRCFRCIKENLQSATDVDTDIYEISMLHAMAVNFTIIEFRVWQYFQVSSKVKELVNDANAVRSKTVNDCKAVGKCASLKT